MKTYKYTDTTNTVAHVIDEDGISRSSMLAAAIPADALVEPADVPPPPPIAPISPRQIRQALTRAGLRSYVEAAVTNGDQDLQDWWEFATAFERTNPQVVAMGVALGQTDEQMDALWVLGASL